jgi:hypothetical protein
LLLGEGLELAVDGLGFHAWKLAQGGVRQGAIGILLVVTGAGE